MVEKICLYLDVLETRFEFFFYMILKSRDIAYIKRMQPSSLNKVCMKQSKVIKPQFFEVPSKVFFALFLAHSGLARG